MVKSMTSFGRSQSEEGKKHFFTLEMKSVNNRYLDINIRLPKFIISVEEEVRKTISKRISRGKVDVFINYKCYGSDNVMPKLDIDLAKKYFDCFNKLEVSLCIPNDITTSKLAKLPDVITLEIKDDDIDEVKAELMPLLENALDFMIEMRQVEGEKLKEDIISKLDVIENQVKEIEVLAEDVPKLYKAKLEERIAELTSGMQLDEEKIATEVAIFTDKVAVDEEFIRLYSHIDQMRKTLNVNEPIGRKLDFILQEMNRETNTIGSKCNDIVMTNIVINIKNLMEKIREQVQNIE